MATSPFDALLNEDQEMIAQAVADFARDAVLPQHEHLDHANTHPEELWGELAELGLFGTFIPEDLGGAGAGLLGYSVVIARLARAAGLAGMLPLVQGVVTYAVLKSGDSEAIEQWLDGLASGELLAAPALAEDNLARLSCTAEGSGREVKLSGTKTGVPFPGRAGLYLVRALRGEEEVLVAVSANAEGITHSERDHNLGLYGLETAPLELAGVAGIVLGSGALLDEVLTATRVLMASWFAGLGAGAIDHAARYSAERKQFKLELRQFGAIQARLSAADAAVEAGRGLAMAAAKAIDSGHAAGLDARRARLFAGDAALAAADHATQVYGGFGYSREYPVERFYRDARFLGLGEHHPAENFRAVTAGITS